MLREGILMRSMIQYSGVHQYPLRNRVVQYKSSEKMTRAADPVCKSEKGGNSRGIGLQVLIL